LSARASRVALCRRHYMERIGEAEARQLRLSLVGG
jgi:hypothetical protein